MIALTKGKNNIFVIDNNHNLDCTGHTIDVRSDMSFEVLTIELVPLTSTTRYIKFELELVNTKQEEDKLNGKYFLESGMHTVQYNCDYHDILFVEFDELDDYNYDQDEIITTATTDNSVFVYNR